MKKIKILLKDCCLDCDHFDQNGIKGLTHPVFSCCGDPERVIACGHMDVCYKYRASALDANQLKKETT